MSKLRAALDWRHGAPVARDSLSLAQWRFRMKRVPLLRLKLLALVVLTLLAPKSGKADDIDIQKAHVQALAEQANALGNDLGGLVNAMSLGGLSFVVTIGSKAPALEHALQSNQITNPSQSATFP